MLEKEDESISPEELKEAKNIGLSLPIVKKLVSFYETTHEDDLQQMYINVTNRLKKVNLAIKYGKLSDENTGKEIEALLDIITKFPKIRDGMIALKNFSRGEETKSDAPESETERMKRLGL